MADDDEEFTVPCLSLKTGDIILIDVPAPRSILDVLLRRPLRMEKKHFTIVATTEELNDGHV